MKHALSVLLLSAVVTGASAEIPLIQMRGKIPVLNTRPSRHALIRNSAGIDVRKVPMRLPQGSSLWGYLGYSDQSDFQAGLYDITEKGFNLKWGDMLYNEAGLTFNTGWLRNGTVCGYMPFYYLSQLVSVLYVAYDINTGYPVDFIDQDINNGLFEIAAYNSDTDEIYGYGYDAMGNWQFMKAPADSPFAFSPVYKIGHNEENQICSALTYNSVDKHFYGINADKKLVRIAINGKQTPVMDVSRYIRDYISGLCYMPSEDKFYWNATLQEPGMLSDVSYLYTIDAEAKKTAEVFEYENSEQFMFFITDDTDLPETAPAAPVFKSVDFGAGSNSGQLILSLSTTTIGGTALDGDLQYVIRIDGSDYASGTGTPGETLNIGVNDLAGGLHQLSGYVTSGQTKGVSASRSIFIGNDTPKAPGDVRLSKTEVSWDAVTQGVNGGYVDASAMTYKVYINGILEGTTSALTYPVTITSNTPLRAYTASVIATWDNKDSSPTYSNTLIEGKPLNLDVTIIPTLDQARLCTVSDLDGDGYGWYFSSDETAFISEYNETDQVDDWLWLPVMNFDNADILYRLTFECTQATASEAAEYLEIKFGSAPDVDNMTVPVMSSFSPVAGAYRTYEALFNIPAAMTGYIGFHAMSDPNQTGMKLKNIHVSRTEITGEAPDAVTNLTATGPGTLENKATITFTMPLKDVKGNTLSAADMTAEIESAAEKVSVSGKPGQKLSAVVRTSEGSNNITVTPMVAGLRGVPAAVSVYTGLDVPSPVTDLQKVESPDMLSLSLSWKAPEKGYNGGGIVPADVEYDIYQLAPTLMGNSWQFVETVRETRYDFMCAPDTEQQIIQIGIVSKNKLGDASRVVSATAIMGAPLELPIDEDFETPYGPEINPWLIYTPDSSYSADWGFGDLQEFLGVGEGTGIIGESSRARTYGRLGMPRFSTYGITNTDVTLDIYTGDGAAQTSLLAQIYGQEPVEIYKIQPGSGYAPVTFRLPEWLDGHKWVQLYIESYYQFKTDFTAIGRIAIMGQLSGVEQVCDNNVMVYGRDNMVVITGAANKAISISDLAGAAVYSAISGSDYMSVPLGSGAYVVRIENNTFKIIL